LHHTGNWSEAEVLILDRYIIRQFLMNFIILLIVFMTLFIIGDMLIEMDEFVDAGTVYAKEQGGSVLFGTIAVAFDYYAPTVMMLYVFFSGVLVVGAMGFTFTNMVRNREMLAMIAGGINMYRIAMPVLLLGCVLNLLTIVVQEVLIPPLANKLTRGKGELDKQESKRLRPIQFVADSEDNLFSAVHFDVQRNTLRDLTILERNKKGIAIRRITAGQAIWDDHARAWELVPGTAIRYVDDAEPIIEEVQMFETNLSPRVLLARDKSMYLRLLSVEDLREMRRNPSLDSDLVRQIMHSRFSLLVVNVLVLVMGMPFFLKREPSNLFVPAVRAAGICLGAWAVGLVVLQLGSGTLPPVLAAWLPVVFYLPLSAILMQFVRS